MINSAILKEVSESSDPQKEATEAGGEVFHAEVAKEVKETVEEVKETAEKVVENVKETVEEVKETAEKVVENVKQATETVIREAGEVIQDLKEMKLKLRETSCLQRLCKYFSFRS